MPSNAPKGNLHMSIISKRLVSIAASTVLLSLVSAGANAEVKFHHVYGFGEYQLENSFVYSTKYTFQKSMILNSLAFYTRGETMSETSYSLNGGSRINLVPASTVDSVGFQWYAFSGGMSINEGTTLEVFTVSADPTTYYIQSLAPYNFTNQEIVFNGGRGIHQSTVFDGRFTNSNIGINVAPEPGSFALALTGGAALIGVCIRRRRTAA
jgi:hypothetical protein